MARLIAKSPCAGLLPMTIGTLSLTEVAVGKAFAVAPFKRQEKAVSDAMPIAFPKPNRVTGTDPRAIWIGPGQALVIGTDLPELPAAVVDQSDSWAIVQVAGPDVLDVLARLVPVDLRTMRSGQTARTMIAHMTGSVTKVGTQAFELMVMRSMAGTLVHDLERAARIYFAR
ncbi:sarcosine oxidase subunit gamma [Cognatiyoonia koreensis]|uniref:Sarcosine oxidase subunit gamma n=1 Tax=Cognatiyoonia koreensis TaxID=364200 RepID=A0A1I0NB97_9RHOB|nr:sarcosine oxidase subunit gamma [Cognatiyoonia koreensis]SEV98461.1 sarcosine oxidase subunit gamma [Cognatiyoonia koreensis]